MMVLTCGGSDAIVAASAKTGAPIDHTVVEEGTVLHMQIRRHPGRTHTSPNAGALLTAHLAHPEGQAVPWKH